MAYPYSGQKRQTEESRGPPGRRRWGTDSPFRLRGRRARQLPPARPDAVTNPCAIFVDLGGIELLQSMASRNHQSLRKLKDSMRRRRIANLRERRELTMVEGAKTNWTAFVAARLESLAKTRKLPARAPVSPAAGATGPTLFASIIIHGAPVIHRHDHRTTDAPGSCHHGIAVFHQNEGRE